jgi:hypothetical protein
MDNNKYPSLYPYKGVTILLSGCAFFFLINIIVYLVFHKSSLGRPRFFQPASYEEIDAKISQVERDQNKKIIFLGGSSVYGGNGIPTAAESIPLQFAQFVTSGVSVYNFSFSAARPLDRFIIVTRLSGKADLFIDNVDASFLKADYSKGIQDDYSKYIRIQSLLIKNARELFDQSNYARECLANYKVLPRPDYSFNLARILPLLRYKSDVNYSLFGKHFSLFFDTIISGVLEILKPASARTVVWKELFKSGEEGVDGIAATSTIAALPVERLNPSINSCLTTAYSHYVSDKKLPFVFFVSPSNPIVVAKEKEFKYFEENKIFINNLFNGVKLFRFDDSVASSTDFVDQNHFTTTGAHKIAESIYMSVRKIPSYTSLFK